MKEIHRKWRKLNFEYKTLITDHKLHGKRK